MSIFKTEITETLQRTIEVEADNEGDALRKVKEMYKNEEIVLDSSDFVGVEIKKIWIGDNYCSCEVAVIFLLRKK